MPPDHESLSLSFVSEKSLDMEKVKEFCQEAGFVTEERLCAEIDKFNAQQADSNKFMDRAQERFDLLRDCDWEALAESKDHLVKFETLVEEFKTLYAAEFKYWR